nr:hypothetical protein [Acholeplasmatales bacterium]
IYDKMENMIDEYQIMKSPYLYGGDNLLVYCENSNVLKYGYVDSKSYYNLQTKCYIDDYLSKSFADQESEVGNWLTFTEYGDDVKKITNSFYFEKLGHMHGLNTDGTCGVVAIQIMLGYYDTFSNDNIIDEKYDHISKSTANNIYDFTYSPGSQNDFHNELIRFASSKNISDNGVGMNVNQCKDITREYLNNRNIKYDCKWIEGNWHDSTHNVACNHIREAIDANRPIFVGGAGHATVAYAYDSKYVYVHSGWGDVRRTPWETYNNDFWDFFAGTFTIDIVSIFEQYHSDNYYSTTLHNYLCPCGLKLSEQRVHPSDYGFAEAYYPNPVQKNIKVGALSFSTNRLRCGYIEEESINISSRRDNAGLAYIEYEFNNNIRKITAELSLWSNSERLYTSDSTLKIEYYNQATGKWIQYLDLLKDINISKDRKNKDQICINLPNNCRKIRFISTSLASGDRNKGRLAIGDLNVIYI